MEECQGLRRGNGCGPGEQGWGRLETQSAQLAEYDWPLRIGVAASQVGAAQA